MTDDEAVLIHPMMKIPEDWQPQGETVRLIRREFPMVDHQRSHSRFVDFHLAKGDRSASWDSAFRLWIDHDSEKIENQIEDGTDYRGVPHNTAAEWDNYLRGDAK